MSSLLIVEAKERCIVGQHAQLVAREAHRGVNLALTFIQRHKCGCIMVVHSAEVVERLVDRDVRDELHGATNLGTGRAGVVSFPLEGVANHRPG